MTRQDVAVLGAFLVMQVLMAPVQHHVFESSCLGQRASEEDDENELRARRFATLADGPLYRNRWFLYPRVLIMLAIAATAYLRRRLPDQRKRVLLANFATMWGCHLVVNLRMLYLGVQQPVLSPAMIACQACLGLSCHLMLPLNPHRRRDDVCAFAAVVLAHSVGALLIVPPEEASLFAAVLAFGSIVPVTMRCLAHERQRLERESEQAGARRPNPNPNPNPNPSPNPSPKPGPNPSPDPSPSPNPSPNSDPNQARARGGPKPTKAQEQRKEELAQVRARVS